ncbi:hypothetical protein T11_17612 [Trichinella zimbabwensis]|uniref:Neuronal membrane glycoprotein M6-b n=1 Tax=Trichinella zimbabwensis TaxID=268475 RepID=A0A0V1HMW2_9BILA|nr:hypothetical protein T11_17612 [Trichinella zimbabwensis]
MEKSHTGRPFHLGKQASRSGFFLLSSSSSRCARHQEEERIPLLLPLLCQGCWQLSNSSHQFNTITTSCGWQVACLLANNASMSCTGKGAFPVGSFVALVVCWLGVAVFCLKMYAGVEAMEELASDVFAFLLPWTERVKLALIVLAGVMLATTSAMCLVGFFATRHLECAYKGRPSSCLCSRLGSRLACALFWALTYALNICWLGILCIVVVLISAFLFFTPICLPQVGLETERCFNFSLVSLLMARGNQKAAVSLILCGDPVSKFCKLTQVFAPWYWSALIGCVAVLLGLSHFNGCLAANFAHVKHACRYRKLRNRSFSFARSATPLQHKVVLHDGNVEPTVLKMTADHV